MADGGGPPEQCRSEGMPSLGEAPNGGARALGYLGLFQVTRCKSETASSHHRRNGYAPSNPNPQSQNFLGRTAFPSSSACKNRFTAALSNDEAPPDFRWRTADDRY
ncbi:hypothetical protein EAH74_08825 [Pseudomonas mandelii]|uniref:Uncharacterized protein n=1 Tax=Pseudomonas mandelii TaxID=75612 RepID=A0A502IIV1_9PSED|nr:hypothetical protein EAH74_08825 [Pseudomonas mandelii]